MKVWQGRVLRWGDIRLPVRVGWDDEEELWYIETSWYAPTGERFIVTGKGENFFEAKKNLIDNLEKLQKIFLRLDSIQYEDLEVVDDDG